MSLIKTRHLEESYIKPHCFKPLKAEGLRWFNIYRSGDLVPIAKLAILITINDDSDPICQVHLDVEQGPISNVKFLCKVLEEEFIPTMRDLGVIAIVSMNIKTTKEMDKRHKQFARIFGFDRPVEMIYAERRL